MPQPQKPIYTLPHGSELPACKCSIGGFEFIPIARTSEQLAQTFAMIAAAKKFLDDHAEIPRLLGDEPAARAFCMFILTSDAFALAMNPKLFTVPDAKQEGVVPRFSRERFLNLVARNSILVMEYFQKIREAAESTPAIFKIMALLRSNPEINDKFGKHRVRAASANLCDVAAQRSEWSEALVKQARARLRKMDRDVKPFVEAEKRRQWIGDRRKKINLNAFASKLTAPLSQ